MFSKYLVFTGRPNAGKSSLIKEIVGLDLKTGKYPGTTKQISEYPLGKGLILIDMPGYGKMMRVSKRLENKINRRIIHFLESNSQNIALAVHVLDISTFLEVTERLDKKGFISLDIEMIQLLKKTTGEFPLVAANKTDKGDRKEIDRNLRAFEEEISERHPIVLEEHVFPVSVKTGFGVGALKSAIHGRLVIKGYKTPFK